MASEEDRLLIREILHGPQPQEAWKRLVDRFEGRLRAFFYRNLKNKDFVDDLVQETFNGLAISLKNYDQNRELQPFLFQIAHFKLTDVFRKHGHEMVQTGSDSSSDVLNLATSRERSPSSDARSHERRELEAEAIRRHLGLLLSTWREDEEFTKIQILELLWVKGMRNRDVAAALGVEEGHVANVRFAAVQKLNDAMRSANLPTDVFPELLE